MHRVDVEMDFKVFSEKRNPDGIIYYKIILICLLVFVDVIATVVILSSTLYYYLVYDSLCWCSVKASAGHKLCTCHAGHQSLKSKILFKH